MNRVSHETFRKVLSNLKKTISEFEPKYREDFYNAFNDFCDEVFDGAPGVDPRSDLTPAPTMKRTVPPPRRPTGKEPVVVKRTVTKPRKVKP